MFSVIRYINQRIHEKYNIMSDELKATSLIEGEAYSFMVLEKALSETKGQYFSVIQTLSGERSLMHISRFENRNYRLWAGEAFLVTHAGEITTTNAGDMFVLIGIHNI